MLIERMVTSLVAEGIITDEEKEIVRFGLESLAGNLLSFVMTLVIGFCFRQIECALLLWLLLFPLRKNAGGFHASTKTKCFLVSAFMILLAFSIHVLPNRINILCGISIFITGYIIWVLAPVDNPSKKLDAIEHKVYRIRSRSILVLESTLLVLAFYFKWEIVIQSITSTFFLVSLSLIMGTIKSQQNR